MKRKKIVFVMALLMFFSTITIPCDIKVEAEDLSTNDPDIDHTYIYLRTKGHWDKIK